MSTIDQTNDPGYAHLVALLKTHPNAYDLVKTAAIEEDFTALPDDAFAWPGERRFPIHAAHHAVLSHLYAKMASNVPDDVFDKIAEALDAYGVDASQLQPATVKEAAADPDEYLFPEQGLYRVKTAEDLFAAQGRLLEQVQKLTPEQRAQGFGRLYKRATELGQPLDPRSYQYAGVVESDLREVRASLEMRAAAAKDEEVQTAYMKLATTLGAYPRKLRDRNAQVKLAQFISDLDEKAGLRKHYDRKLSDPVRTVFNTDRLTKTADQMVDLGGDVFPLTQLASVSPQVYGDILGPDIVSEICTPGGQDCDPMKIAQILPTLPADMKSLLGQKLRAALGG
jgi:hypothetical protein